MRLQSGPRSVELKPLGYEFPGHVPEDSAWDWDANWLRIGGEVQDGTLEWQFIDPCLTTRDARELLDWLRLVARDLIDPEEERHALAFIEPSLRFELRTRTALDVTLAVVLAHESSPPQGDGVTREDGYEVQLRMPRDDIRTAADAWERELAEWPERIRKQTTP